MTSNHDIAVELAKIGQKLDDLKVRMHSQFNEVNKKIDTINGNVSKNTQFRNMMGGLGKATVIIGVVATVITIIIAGIKIGM